MPTTVEEAQTRYAEEDDYTILDLENDLDRILAAEVDVDHEPEHRHFEEYADEEDVTKAPGGAVMMEFAVDYVEDEAVEPSEAEQMTEALRDNADSLIPPSPDE